MQKGDTVSCERCGAPTTPYLGSGPHPRFCLRHTSRPSRSRERARRAGLAPGDDAPAAGRIPAPLRPRLMAIGLAFTSDVEEAAGLVGLSGDDLEQIAAEARAQHPKLMTLDRRELAHAGEAAIGLALLHGVARIPTSDSSAHGMLSMAERAAALLERVTGASKRLFTNVTIVFSEGDDDATGLAPSGAELIGED